MATSSTKEKGTKQSNRSLASLLDKTGNNPSVTRSGARNEDREDDNSHASTDDEQSGGSGLSAVAADGETSNDNRDQHPSLNLDSPPAGNGSSSGPSGVGETKEKAGILKGPASEQIRKMALAVLARMNATREELGFSPWAATSDMLTHATEHPSATSDECFDDDETKQIKLIHALAQRNAKSKREQSGPHGNESSDSLLRQTLTMLVPMMMRTRKRRRRSPVIVRVNLHPGRRLRFPTS